MLVYYSRTPNTTVRKNIFSVKTFNPKLHIKFYFYIFLSVTYCVNEDGQRIEFFQTFLNVKNLVSSKGGCPFVNA